MSTDTFEDELRSLLRNTADAEGPAYVDVDPDAVVSQGHRVVRRRRLATGAAVAAAVLAIGVGSAVVGGVGQGRAADPVPAGPSSGRAPVTVTLDLGNELQGVPTPGPNKPASVRVVVDEAARTWSVTVVDGAGRRRSVPLADLPANPRFSAYAEVGDGPGLVVGVMPAAAKDLVGVWLVDSVESTFSSAPVPGTDRQVFAVRYSFTPDPNVPGESQTMLAGFDWTDGENVFTSAGTSVRSARLGDAVVFVDEIQGLFGIFGAETTASKQLSDTPQGKVPGLMTARAADGSDTMESTVLALLPAGAQGIAVPVAPGATVQSVDTVPGGSTGRTMVLVRLTEPKASTGTAVERVSWTNPDGSAGSGTIG